MSQSLHESVTWEKSINAILYWSKTLIPRFAREGQKTVIDGMAGSESVSILIPSENCRSRKVMHQQRSDIKAGFMPAFVFEPYESLGAVEAGSVVAQYGGKGFETELGAPLKYIPVRSVANIPVCDSFKTFAPALRFLHTFTTSNETLCSVAVISKAC
ncbi:hypothetical protein [Microbulbifer sp.]|uniref:hypothetical protein n=1 Tax=Microbulbifer sp. TaxID=1908541 RepID=UPI002F92AF84